MFIEQDSLPTLVIDIKFNNLVGIVFLSKDQIVELNEKEDSFFKFISVNKPVFTNHYLFQKYLDNLPEQALNNTNNNMINPNNELEKEENITTVDYEENEEEEGFINLI